jgi:aquaporin Z
MRVRPLHPREYLIEGALLGAFMVSACSFGALVFHPASPLQRVVGTPLSQRVLMGAFMGLTAIALIYSPFGKRSGAHMNPAATLTFLRLGKISGRDAVFYVAAQFAGGALGVLVSVLAIGMWLGHPSIRFVVTEPGPSGVAAAFAGELTITFIQMTMVLHTASSKRAAPFTGIFAGILLAAYIAVESPLSGTSMNPARTVGSALFAGSWTALWVYFTAPVLGMLLASQLFVWRRGRSQVPCAKMVHDTPCIFCGEGRARPGNLSAPILITAAGPYYEAAGCPAIRTTTSSSSAAEQVEGRSPTDSRHRVSAY